jgi:uncharacterized protein (DUF302 family)
MIRSGAPMILERVSSLRLSEIETVLRRAARRRRANVSAVEPLGPAIVFTLSQPDLYSQLLVADVRFSAFLPLRISAYEQAGSVTLLAASPVEFAQGLDHPEVAFLAANLENLVNEFLDETTRPAAMAAKPGGHAESALGATEDQMNMRGTVPQRIDRHGSKVEEMAGTGEQDSPGG